MSHTNELNKSRRWRLTHPKAFRYSATVIAATLLTGCMNMFPALAPKVETESGISAEFPFESQYAEVLDSQVHYVDLNPNNGGETLVFIHGNPTSSYLWRNIMPQFAQSHRVIALDLIGMGKSGKPQLDYTLQDHIRYFDAWVDVMELKDVTLVLHDWGTAIGLNYLANHPTNVKQVVVMEGVMKPMSLKQADFATRYIFNNLRHERKGEKLIVEKNYFVEKLLPMLSGRKLSDAEMENYRAPYLQEAHRTPVRVWPQEVPFDGVPADNTQLLQANYDYLKNSDHPLLLLHAEPGAIFTKEFMAGVAVEIPRATIKNIGPGLHYIQESQPSNITDAIANWLP